MGTSTGNICLANAWKALDVAKGEVLNYAESLLSPGAYKELSKKDKLVYILEIFKITGFSQIESTQEIDETNDDAIVGLACLGENGVIIYSVKPESDTSPRQAYTSLFSFRIGADLSEGFIDYDGDNIPPEHATEALTHLVECFLEDVQISAKEARLSHLGNFSLNLIIE